MAIFYELLRKNILNNEKTNKRTSGSKNFQTFQSGKKGPKGQKTIYITWSPDQVHVLDKVTARQKFDLTI